MKERLDRQIQCIHDIGHHLQRCKERGDMCALRLARQCQ